jgi:hypothetical protein
MTEVGNYLMSSGALFASVFNGSPEYPTLQLTDQASQDAWKQLHQLLPGWGDLPGQPRGKLAKIRHHARDSGGLLACRPPPCKRRRPREWAE